MRPVLRHATLAAACLSALVLAGCGSHVASNAPITYAPADTPYLLANFKGAPADANAAWNQANDAMLPSRVQQFQQLAKLTSQNDPKIAAVLRAIGDEFAGVKTQQELAQKMGFKPGGLLALYGIGDVPVFRVELASPDAFKSFWNDIEKRSGVKADVATIGSQQYWRVAPATSKVALAVAIEGKQLVLTVLPTGASDAVIKQLLGVTKPSSNAASRLASIDSEHGYGEYGSGYVDLPKLVAATFNQKDAVTAAFAQALGAPASDPACASEFASLANQVPLISMGFNTYTAKQVSGSIDAKVSASLLGALTALRQPVPGMDAGNDNSVFDLVVAAPVQKWQAFIADRAKAAASHKYECKALQGLNQFALQSAAPSKLPPEASSIEGVRVVLDKLDLGMQMAARGVVFSSNPAQLTQDLQKSVPQFAATNIPTDGKTATFALPPAAQATFGSPNGWITSNAHGVAIGVGQGSDATLVGILSDPAGNGDRLLRMHFDGKLYPVMAGWLSRFSAMAPAQTRANLDSSIASMQALGKIVKSADSAVSVDGTGVHMTFSMQHL